MNRNLKKFFVIIPVVLLGFFYLNNNYEEFNRRVSEKRLLFLGLSFFILYVWIFIETIRRKQNSFFAIVTQSSFFLYIFMVLTLTGYFILFREISAHNWYENMIMRIDREDHVNLKLFKMFKIYAFSNKQILGNLVMLFPLGIYIPLLYPRLSNFFTVLLISLVFSVIIESFQLVTRFRSADVDDVLLNTIGACVGYLVFVLVKKSGGFDGVDIGERVGKIDRVDKVDRVDRVGRMS